VVVIALVVTGVAGARRPTVTVEREPTETRSWVGTGTPPRSTESAVTAAPSPPPAAPAPASSEPAAVATPPAVTPPAPAEAPGTRRGWARGGRWGR